MGFIDFTNGEVLTADQMDTVLRQSVMRFTDATARDTALSAVLAEGMMCYLDDTNEVLKYDGSSWIDISGDITGVTAGTALTGGGTSGNVTLDVDTAAVGTAIGIDDKQDNVITTQGDLIIGDASGNPVRLPVGSADQVLTSDGTTVSFQDAGGGGGLTEITSGTLSGNSVAITSIPQTYKALRLELNNVAMTSGDYPFLRLNNDSSSDYSLTKIGGSTSVVSVSSESRVTIFDTDLDFGGGESGMSVIDIYHYTSTNNPVLVNVYSAMMQSSTTERSMFNVAAYNNNAAITQLNVFANLSFATGTYILYGVN